MWTVLANFRTTYNERYICLMFFVDLENQNNDNQKNIINLFWKLKHKNNFFVFSMMLLITKKINNKNIQIEKSFIKVFSSIFSNNHKKILHLNIFQTNKIIQNKYYNGLTFLLLFWFNKNHKNHPKSNWTFQKQLWNNIIFAFLM